MKKLTETFNTASVKKGEKFEICLEAASGAGYLWEAHVTSGKARLVSNRHSSIGNRDSIGGPTMQHFVFEAEESGTIEIDAIHKRPWLTQTDKAQSFKISVK